MSEQTLALYKEIHLQHGQIWPGLSLDKWKEKGSPKAIDLLKKLTLDVLENLQPPEDHDELIKKGEDYLINLK